MPVSARATGAGRRRRSCAPSARRARAWSAAVWWRLHHRDAGQHQALGRRVAVELRRRSAATRSTSSPPTRRSIRTAVRHRALEQSGAARGRRRRARRARGAPTVGGLGPAPRARRRRSPARPPGAARSRGSSARVDRAAQVLGGRPAAPAASARPAELRSTAARASARRRLVERAARGRRRPARARPARAPRARRARSVSTTHGSRGRRRLQQVGGDRRPPARRASASSRAARPWAAARCDGRKRRRRTAARTSGWRKRSDGPSASTSAASSAAAARAQRRRVEPGQLGRRSPARSRRRVRRPPAASAARAGGQARRSGAGPGRADPLDAQPLDPRARPRRRGAAPRSLRSASSSSTSSALPPVAAVAGADERVVGSRAEPRGRQRSGSPSSPSGAEPAPAPPPLAATIASIAGRSSPGTAGRNAMISATGDARRAAARGRRGSAATARRPTAGRRPRAAAGPRAAEVRGQPVEAVDDRVALVAAGPSPIVGRDAERGSAACAAPSNSVARTSGMPASDQRLEQLPHDPEAELALELAAGRAQDAHAGVVRSPRTGRPARRVLPMPAGPSIDSTPPWPAARRPRRPRLGGSRPGARAAGARRSSQGGPVCKFTVPHGRERSERRPRSMKLRNPFKAEETECRPTALSG